MDYIFIDRLENRKQIGYVENGHLRELYIDEEESESLIGNIYRARVADVVVGMNAAFIDIGEEKNAYLSLKDALPREKLYDGLDYNISDLLTAGSEIIVQVSRDSYGDKGAKVTTHIELAGKYIIFNPYSNRINVSRKIKNKIRRKRLEDLGRDISLEDYGMIIRTVAEKIEESKIKEEYEYLYGIYKRLKREINFLPCPKLIYRDLKDWEELIRDRNFDRILVNDKSVYDSILEIEDQYELNLDEKIELDKNFSLEYDINLQKELKKALDRTIYLDSGASIVIDEAEALTAIDVNTKSYTGNFKLSRTVVETNLEAAREIGKQIRLRNIGGIIIIDFIRMNSDKDIERVVECLKNEMDKDSIQTDIAGMTRLGLLEVTRKKTRPSLNEVLMTNCTTCKGLGKMNKSIDN